MDRVLDGVLKKITPTEKERDELLNALSKVINATDKVIIPLNLDKTIAGSFIRDTWLTDKKEIDLFILFPISCSREDLEKIGIEVGKKIVKMIREGGGAKEVHMRISSPPTKGPCFYGIDTPSRKELIAATHELEEIKKYITADTLHYLNIEGLMNMVPNSDKFCKACFDDNYPVLCCKDSIEQIDLF